MVFDSVEAAPPPILVPLESRNHLLSRPSTVAQIQTRSRCRIV